MPLELIYTFKKSFIVNVLLHIVQTKGFSPVVSHHAQTSFDDNALYNIKPNNDLLFLYVILIIIITRIRYLKYNKQVKWGN